MQALVLLNGPFLQALSKAFAGRVLREAGADNAARVDLAYRLALCRPPSEAERRVALNFLAGQTELLREPKTAGAPGLPNVAAANAMADFCLALLNRNEFVYVP